jgi:hypothetical protein
MMLINRFVGSCGIFGKEKKNSMSLTTLGQLTQNKIFILKKKNNNHGVDVSMIIII